MDESLAISLLSEPLGTLAAREDRFIAAERLKFFPSTASARAILAFVRAFDGASGTILEDNVARRKAVETLGRYKGAVLQDEVLALLEGLLRDDEPLMVEVAVWALGESGLGDCGANVLEAVAGVLERNDVSRRTVVQALMRARYTPALDRIRALVDDADAPTSSAAATAVCVLSGERSGMDAVLAVLRSDSLTARRAALEDITLAKEVGALAKVVVTPNSLVLRARTVRVLLEEAGVEAFHKYLLDVDRLIWDHPCDLDLLGMVKDTKKARDMGRNVRQLYKNDAIYPYLAAKTLGEDFRGQEVAGEAVLKSFDEQPYFDYFGAYHVFKTLGWLKCLAATEMLLDNAENLPPRFFNHQAGAITALAEIGVERGNEIFEKIVEKTRVWEVKYACLIAAERLGSDGGRLRELLKDDVDWVVRARARSEIDFSHLRSGF